MLLNCGDGEDSWESLGLQGDQTSQSWRKSTLNIHWKDWYWSWRSNTWPPDAKSRLIGKDPDAGKDWRQEKKGTTEDEMIGWHHGLNDHEFEQAPGDGEGQGSLVCCSSWGCKEPWLNDWPTTTNIKFVFFNVKVFISCVLKINLGKSKKKWDGWEL